MLTATSQTVADNALSLVALANPSSWPSFDQRLCRVLRTHTIACVLSKAVFILAKSRFGKPTCHNEVKMSHVW